MKLLGYLQIYLGNYLYLIDLGQKSSQHKIIFTLPFFMNQYGIFLFLAYWFFFLERQIKNDILLRALTAYLRVIQSRESVKFAKQSVENIKKQTELEDAAVSAGGGLTSDVLQAKTQLAGAQARQIQFEGVLDAAKHEFVYVFETFPRDLGSLKLLKSVILWVFR